MQSFQLCVTTPTGRYEAQLPAPFAMIHASSLLLLPDGTALLAAFSGSVEGAAGVAIVLFTLPPGASRWGPARVVFQNPSLSAQNPVLVYSAGVLTLAHTTQPGGAGQALAQVHVQSSRDGGATWGASFTQPVPPGTFLRGQALQQPSGGWVLPAYVTPSGLAVFPNQYSAMLMAYAVPGPQGPWALGPPLPGTLGGLVQPSVVALPDGSWVAFFRSRAGDSVYRATSLDAGWTWSTPTRTGLPNSNSGLQAALLPSGRVALVFNNWNGQAQRWPLTIALSADGGVTFPWMRDLTPDGGACSSPGLTPSSGEYSYPSIAVGAGGTIHVSWTWLRLYIRYAQISEAWVLGPGGTFGLAKPTAASASGSCNGTARG